MFPTGGAALTSYVFSAGLCALCGLLVYQNSAPIPHNARKDVHSIHVKLPGTNGSTFIATMRALTVAPAQATAVPFARPALAM